MGDHRLQMTLKESFSRSSRETWKQAAMREINGDDPFEKLKWKISDELQFSPYYDQEDLKKTEYLKDFQQRPIDQNVPRACANIQKVTVTDVETANRTALQHLNGGADGLLFNIPQNDHIDVHRLLENIEWPYCQLLFDITAPAALSISKYITKKNFQHNSLTGVFFWHALPPSHESLPTAFQEQKGIATHGLIIPPADTPVQEITDALSRGVEALDVLTEKSFAPATCLSHICFSLNMGTSFFTDIAKLKALRLLWFQVAQAYDVQNFHPQHLRLCARSEAWISDNFQPHGNLLKGTLASMAAVLGGADIITVLPEDEDHTTMNRMARNTMNILREESHFDKVSDPLAGCYAVDNIVHALAEEAWNRFTASVR